MSETNTPVAHEQPITKAPRVAKSSVKEGIEAVLFGSKWMLILFYLGLIVALGFYAIYFFFELQHLIHVALKLFEHATPEMLKEGIKAGAANPEVRDGILLGILELVDITMIANLVKMIITGSYHSFVSKHHGEESEKASSGMLKVKMSTSLVGVSSIHLLKAFINAQNITSEELTKLLIIHGSFLVGALILAVIDHLHVRSEVLEHQIEASHKSH